MVSEEAGGGRRGDHPLRAATGGIRIAVVVSALNMLWAVATGGSAQERPADRAPRLQQEMDQALRALGRGLTDRAEELGAGTDSPLVTGSIRAPFPLAWIAPRPLQHVARLEPSSGLKAGRDFARLFNPDPFGTPERLRRPQAPSREQASLPEPPATAPVPLPSPTPTLREPAAAAVQMSPPVVPAPREHAALPDPQIGVPAPPAPLTVPAPAAAAPTPAAATPTVPAIAALPPPKQEQPTIPAPPAATPAPPRQEQAAIPAPDPVPAQQPPPAAHPRPAAPPVPGRTAARPSEDPQPDARPEATKPAERAGRATPARRTAARPAEDPQDETEPKPKEPRAKEPTARPAPPERARTAVRPPDRSAPDDADERTAQRPATAPKAAAKRAPLVSPEVTGAIARSAAARLEPKAQARSARDTGRPASDIPAIPLPDALRPTRPPAGSPL